LKILAEKAHSLGIRLAVEDLPRTCLGNCSDDILYLLEGNPLLNVCFDTNHLLKQDNVEFIKAVGNRIITLHVSDYDFIDERHQLPGEGKNNWNAIINELEKVNYSGPFLYEVSSKASPNHRTGPELKPKDLRENHLMLIENYIK
jgi:sugar phosphate isomerase/epimerase